jgi:hypothetical protein
MRRLLGLLTSFLVLTLIGSYAWTHRQHLIAAVAAPANGADPAAIPTYAEVQEARKAVNVAGPLAGYMASQQPGAGEQTARIETLQPISQKTSSENATTQPTSAADHVGDSPVGTSNRILHQMFKVAGTVQLQFEVPAHAANPQLRGSYQSFVRRGGVLSSDDAEVGFLVLNDQQYVEFVKGRGSEAVFSADEAHDQEVNTGLPPTLDQPAKYYLIFRNGAHAATKVVQAEFRIDF